MVLGIHSIPLIPLDTTVHHVQYLSTSGRQKYWSGCELVGGCRRLDDQIQLLEICMTHNSDYEGLLLLHPDVEDEKKACLLRCCYMNADPW